MSNIRLINFIDLPLKDKEMILNWRNSDNIRKWMYNRELITLENHLNYIESLKNKEDRIYFLLQKDNESIGVIDFTSINSVDGNAEIGLYTNPMLNGVGSILMSFIIDYGFNKLHLNKLFANVFANNTKAIRLYNKYNFLHVEEKNSMLKMELKNENR